MRVLAFRLLSLVVCLGMFATAVAAPPEKDEKPSEKPAAAKPAAEKKAETKPAAKIAEKKADEKKVEAKKPEPTKQAAKKPAGEKKNDDKAPATAKKPAEEKKPVAMKPAVRKPTRVDPSDSVTQSIAAATVKPAKPLTPGGKYPAGDMSRPRPAVIAPPTESAQNQPGRAPSDAIVLFDGVTFARWKKEGGPKSTDPNAKPSDEPQWVIKNGYMECQPRSGGIATRDSFGDCQLHIEWATPSVVKGSSQGRGNSGVLLHGIGEVQVLDSYENDTYPDGQASAIYSKYPPLVNASRRPGEWQTYDIIVELAKIDPKTNQVTRPARLTVLHNGVLTHIAAEIPDSRAQQFSFGLQDHGNPVRYRNIWLRPLKGYDATAGQELVMKAELKVEAKTEAKVVTKTEVKTEAKPAAVKVEVRPAAAKAATKPEAKAEAKPAAKVEPKSAAKSEAKASVKIEVKPAAKPEAKPEAVKKQAEPKAAVETKKPADVKKPNEPK